MDQSAIRKVQILLRACDVANECFGGIKRNSCSNHCRKSLLLHLHLAKFDFAHCFEFTLFTADARKFCFPNMGSVFIQVGQCGNQIGDQISQQFIKAESQLKGWALTQTRLTWSNQSWVNSLHDNATGAKKLPDSCYFMLFSVYSQRHWSCRFTLQAFRG